MSNDGPIQGRVDERRREFIGIRNGVAGTVEFKRSWLMGHHSIPRQAIRVQLDDGREGHATYISPKDVLLKIRRTTIKDSA